MDTLKSWAFRLLDLTSARKLARSLNKLWVRITAIALVSLVAIVIARFTENFATGWSDQVINRDKVSDLLEIIANSMLAITIFSLSVMVSVFRTASSQWTPRVHRLMLGDQTTQNTLATFLGAYLYALAALILIDTDVFASDQVFVLFLFTVLILLLIIVAIVRWIIHLQSLGSLVETTRRIEEKAAEAFRYRMDKPCLGGRCLVDPGSVPSDAAPLPAYATGYVQHVYEDSFSDLAEARDVEFFLTAPIGEFVHEGAPVGYVSGEIGDVETVLRDNFAIGDLRTFEQDPRFGLIVLAEIGSKAMSPGVNDPGTAIDVIGRISRLFESHVGGLDHVEGEVKHPRLWVRPLSQASLVQDAFDPIARDAAGVVEVQLALRHALIRLGEHRDQELAEAAIAAAERALRRAEAAMPHAGDRRRLREVGAFEELS